MSEPEPLDAGSRRANLGRDRNAISEAKVLAVAGEFGPDLLDVVRHARELNDLMLEQMRAAEPDAAAYLRGMCESIGNNIGTIEQLVGIEKRSPPAVH